MFPDAETHQVTNRSPEDRRGPASDVQTLQWLGLMSLEGGVDRWEVARFLQPPTPRERAIACVIDQPPADLPSRIGR
jgi:hypothetical protein